MPTNDPMPQLGAAYNATTFTNSNLLGRTAAYQSTIGATGQGLQVIQDQSTSYGIGLTLPFSKTDATPFGFHIAMSTAQAVQADLINLVMTQKGERLMNDQFGTNLNRFLFYNKML